MLSVKGITSVGGFLRYGFSLYPFGEHALSDFRFSPEGIMATILESEAAASKHSGGFNLKRYPRDVVIAHARRMNTPANARKMAWLDSGPYKISR